MRILKIIPLVVTRITAPRHTRHTATLNCFYNLPHMLLQSCLAPMSASALIFNRFRLTAARLSDNKPWSKQASQNTGTSNGTARFAGERVGKPRARFVQTIASSGSRTLHRCPTSVNGPQPMKWHCNSQASVCASLTWKRRQSQAQEGS